MLTSENEKISHIGKRSLANTIGCLGEKHSLFSKKNDRNLLYCQLSIECIQNNDHQRIKIIKELIDVKEGNSYVPLIPNNDLKTSFDDLCT